MRDRPCASFSLLDMYALRLSDRIGPTRYPASTDRLDLSNAGSVRITSLMRCRISVSREPSFSSLLSLAGANEAVARAAARSWVERETVADIASASEMKGGVKDVSVQSRLTANARS